MMNWVNRRFVSIVLVVLLVVASATFVGCGINVEDDKTTSDMESISKNNLLDADSSVNIWWDGTPGSDYIDINISKDEEMFRQYFMMRNNTDKKIVVTIKFYMFNDNSNREEKIKLYPNSTKKSFVDLNIVNFILKDMSNGNKLGPKLGKTGPRIEFLTDSSDTIILSTRVFVYDPEIEIDWGGLPRYMNLEYSDRIQKTLTVTNNGTSGKCVSLWEMREKCSSYSTEFWPRFDIPKRIEPGETISYDYEIFYRDDKNCDCEKGLFRIFVSVDNKYEYFRNCLTSVENTCQNWITKWKGSPDQKTKEINISPGEIVETTVMLTNPCDKDRILNLKLHKPTKSFIFSFPEEEYKVPAKGTIEIPLTIEIHHDEGNFVSRYSLDMDFLKKYGAKSSHPLKLDINFDFKAMGKERFKTKLGLPFSELKNKNLYKIQRIYNDNILLFQSGIELGSRRGINNILPLLICIDTNSGDILWNFYDKNINYCVWSKQIKNKLFLKAGSIKEYSGYFNFTSYDSASDIVCINLDNGNLISKNYVEGISFTIYPDDGIYFFSNKMNESDDNNPICSRIDVETGEKTDYFDGSLNVMSIIRGGTDFRFDNGNIFDEEREKKASIKRLDSNTGEIIWEITDKYEFNQILSYYQVMEDKPSTWYVSCFHDCSDYIGKRLQLAEKFIYYVFSEKLEVESLYDAGYVISCDGIGCIDSETGEILWENRDMGRIVLHDGDSNAISEDNNLFFNYDGKKIINISKVTGETINYDSKKYRIKGDEFSMHLYPNTNNFYLKNFEVHSMKRKINKEAEGLSSIAIEYRQSINNSENRDTVCVIVFGPEDFAQTLYCEHYNYITDENCIYALFDNMVVCYEKQGD
jgi:hypothetical protein